jgi:hypothetical protein
MDGASDGRRPTRLVLGAAALFVVAVFLARLLLAGGMGWVAFGLVVPVLLFALTAASGFRFALAATTVFVLAVLALRWFLARSPTGWVALLLIPVLVFTAVLVGRVLAQLKRDRDARRHGAPAETADPVDPADAPVEE